MAGANGRISGAGDEFAAAKVEYALIAVDLDAERQQPQTRQSARGVHGGPPRCSQPNPRSPRKG